MIESSFGSVENGIPLESGEYIFSGYVSNNLESGSVVHERADTLKNDTIFKYSENGSVILIDSTKYDVLTRQHNSVTPAWTFGVNFMINSSKSNIFAHGVKFDKSWAHVNTLQTDSIRSSKKVLLSCSQLSYSARFNFKINNILSLGYSPEIGYRRQQYETETYLRYESSKEARNFENEKNIQWMFRVVHTAYTRLNFGSVIAIYGGIQHDPRVIYDIVPDGSERDSITSINGYVEMKFPNTEQRVQAYVGIEAIINERLFISPYIALPVYAEHNNSEFKANNTRIGLKISGRSIQRKMRNNEN